MARIKTYSQDTPVSKIDKVLGTDGDPGINYGATKNFTVASLAAFIGGGSAGAAGASAYDLWITAGNSGTVADFLTSLVGASGSQGAAGATGSQGASGADGTSINIQGTKPTVGDLPASGATGDLWIIDQTGGGATAGDGYVWTAGGAWANIGPLRGPQGIQGAAGAQGIQGIQGTQGIQGIQGIAGAAGSTTELLTFTPGILFSDGTSPVIVASQGKLIKTEISGSPNKYIYTFQGDVTFDSSDTNGNALNNMAVKVTASNISDGSTLSISPSTNNDTQWGNLTISYNVSQAAFFFLANSNLRTAMFQATSTTVEWKTLCDEMDLKSNIFSPGNNFNMKFVNNGNVRVQWESTLTT